MSDTYDLIMGAYEEVADAHADFDALVALIKDKKLRSDGAVLIEHGEDGRIRVAQTGDRRGRRGLGWVGGVAVLVGLTVPRLIASVAVGPDADGVVDRFIQHRVDTGLDESIGDLLVPGTAAVVSLVDDEDRLAAEQALAAAPGRAFLPLEKASLDALKEALVAATRKFFPDRTVLPLPDKAFGGVVGRTLKQSAVDWSFIPGPSAPEDAPNVLVVLIDDAGFGAIDSFGGPVHTPTFSRVQQMGVTYNRFHVTAVCSPTRAALLTGRNQHRIGFGCIAECPAPFPGYSASKPRSCAALPRILRDNGYVTGGFGKWHLTPDFQQGAAGPFEHWPTAWGFDHFWGFLSAAAGQYDPIIVQDGTALGIMEGEDGEPYYFPDDLTDKAVEWLHAVRAQDAHKPWFMYYATGCAHAPHHVAKAWADKYKGQFDDGWDALRERTLARQKELGVVPADTELTPRPDLFPAWDSLSDDQKKLYVRQMEVYAGYQENADWNVGRLMDALEEMGDLEDTLVFFIWGDNGASMEGTTTGSFNEMTFLNGLVLEADEQLELIEKYGGIEGIGGVHTAPHVAAAWAHACNAPFQWGKQMASHLGGTRDPMVVAWPARLKPDAQVRSQFTHCIDIAPTVLEAAGIPEPSSVDGIAQEPMDGTSFLYTLDAPEAPERHTQQYFEMIGSRAMYKDGWWAASRLDRIPWDFSPETLAAYGPDADWDADEAGPWELYYLPDDFSQAHDLAAQHPEKVEELRQLWWAEAERNRVLPLMGGISLLYGILPPLPTVARFEFAGDVQNIQHGMAPRIMGRSYSIEGELVIPEGGAEGVIVAFADFIGGYALWVGADGLLRHTYSMLGVETYKQVATEKLPIGAVTVKLLCELDEPKTGSAATVTLYADGKQIGEGRMPQTVPVGFTLYSGMDVGRDNGLVVDLDYEPMAPYAFTGTVKKVTFDLKPHVHEDEVALHHHESIQQVAAGAAG